MSPIKLGKYLKIFQSIWTDLNSWLTWHGDLDYCKLDDDFKIGNNFMLKPQNVNPIKIVLTDINEEQHFTNRNEFFGAKMYDTHAMENKGWTKVNLL